MSVLRCGKPMPKDVVVCGWPFIVFGAIFGSGEQESTEKKYAHESRTIPQKRHDYRGRLFSFGLQKSQRSKELESKRAEGQRSCGL